jgi:hypothetical protein
MEQVAAVLNRLCWRWLDHRHARRQQRTWVQRLSQVARYHQRRNQAATQSRLRRYQQTEGAL